MAGVLAIVWLAVEAIIFTIVNAFQTVPANTLNLLLVANKCVIFVFNTITAITVQRNQFAQNALESTIYTEVVVY